MGKNVKTQERIDNYINQKKGYVNKNTIGKTLKTGGLSILPVLTLSIASTNEAKATTYFRNNAQVTSVTGGYNSTYFLPPPDLFNGQTTGGFIYFYPYGGSSSCSNLYGVFFGKDVLPNGVTGFGAFPGFHGAGVSITRNDPSWKNAPDNMAGSLALFNNSGGAIRERYVFYKSPARIGWAQVSLVQLCDGSKKYRFVIHDYAFTDANSITTPSGSLPSLDCCPPLPVELVRFDAHVGESNIALRWQTASEINNAGFEIQRSTDGKNFQTISFVEGNGSSAEQHEYLYDDKALRSGQLYYYRLKQIDYDGQFEYSDVITAQLKSEETSARFSPNPSTNGQTLLDYSTTSEGQLNLQFYDVTGKELKRQTHEVAEGNNRFNLDLSGLGRGVIFVKMEQEGRSVYQKLILQ